ncbi:uncharacterized protein SCHCODRAFT_02085956 [Schizophyllum commune H4-8]|uniref:uncharacterized protein n=1 Tax=Schizophyllum commune (strain H4-8 / FGSC 9210) TaxID=578458 RepID=UPI00215EBE6E|nr:uncharacterized protein SCHCODRAFT_02085956 [Schizophyllum commune H4-8]KAI5886973.1 hypothetical protein SCHCODRAFT_02085956 [Schizophyllum commune H4-8]
MVSNANNQVLPNLYDDLHALDAEDARVWSAWYNARRPEGRPERIHDLDEYWRKARDPNASKELYSDVDGCCTFVPCPLLPFSHMQAILIRREYEAAWRDLEKAFVVGDRHFTTTEGPVHYAGHPTPSTRAPFNHAFALTGHPGIGKTMFLAFALLRCLERHWTVLLHLSANEICIFNSVGVWQMNPLVSANGLARALPWTTWCLVDSNATTESVPYAISTLNLFTVQAAAARRECIKWLSKRDTPSSCYLMHPMSIEEAQISFSLKPDREQTEGSDRVIQEYFDKYGPDTRFACVAALDMDSCSWEKQSSERLEVALLGLTLARLQVLFRISRGPRFDAESASAILCIRPGVERDVVEVDFVSAHVLLHCADKLSVSLNEISQHSSIGRSICNA